MWEPPEFAWPDEWADAKRVMPAGSPFPGPWDTNRTPYLRAPMRAWADPAVDVVVAIMRRQRGKTELGINCLGWTWDTCPAPSLWINPTETLARSFSNDRVKKMFATIPGLAERTYEKREGALEKFIDGVRFGVGWAGSRTETASHPSKYSVIDERSRMTEDIGGEGDPVRIVQAGGGMFPGATTLIISSPTEEGVCPTFDWWAQGTRQRWAWRCPQCGEWFVACLETAKFPEKASYETIRAEACIACPHCEHKIRDDTKADVEAAYKSSTVSDEGVVTLAPELEARNSVASYWVTGLADQITHIGQAMEQYARAARTGKEPDVQACVNTVHGELFKVKVERLRSDVVKERQVAGIPDDAIQLVTVGVDVQADCLYYVVRGWCEHVTSYLLDHGRILGATEYVDVWLQLARALDTTFIGHQPAMVLVDSGHQTAMVYQQCRLRPAWEPAKGQPTGGRPYHDSLVDETASGRAKKTLRLWLHSADVWQQWINGRLQWPVGEPGCWYVPAGVETEYAEQVVNQGCRVRKGKREWFAMGNRDDHYRDCEILAAIAADIKGARRLRAPKAKPEAAPDKPAGWVAERQARINSARERIADPFERRGL